MAIGSVQVFVWRGYSRRYGQHTRARALTAYPEHTLITDRERFVAEQKAALVVFDTRLVNRDMALVQLMSVLLASTRGRVVDELERVVEKMSLRR